MVAGTSKLQDWDVEVGGRIEHVTDDSSFADRCEEALAREVGLSIVRFDRPVWPHTTSVVLRLTATTKKKAEEQARQVFLRLLLQVARDMTGDMAHGWTVRADAMPAGFSTTSL